MNMTRLTSAKGLAIALTAVALAGFGTSASFASDRPMAPLPLELPTPGYAGTPQEMPPDTTAEKPTGKPRPPFLAPQGVKNVALNKPVTSSDAPISGELKLITDGNKEAFDEGVVVLRRRTQWVQVDLEKESEIYVIMLWHEHKTPLIYRDVVVQVSNDPDFIEGVTTLFNNDQDNSSGLGVGTDREYFEGYEGKLINAKGVKARYVRCYSRGSTESALNCYTEIEVFALPVQ
jgi:hypothetical protein